MESNGLLVGRLSGSLKLGSLCNIQTLMITLLFHLRLVVLRKMVGESGKGERQMGVWRGR